MYQLHETPLTRSNMIYLRVTSKKLLPAFLYYFLLNEYSSGRITQYGTHQPFVKASDILAIKVNAFDTLGYYVKTVTKATDANIEIRRVGNTAGRPVQLLREELLE